MPSERNYRTGRVLATLVTWVGWLVAAAGAAVVPLVLAADPQMLQRDFPTPCPWGLSVQLRRRLPV